jgi:glycosyltransferase involved in cell wall biosynthesis
LKILISSHAFAPSVGGIETVSSILARQWKLQGHEIEIVTETPGELEWEGLPVHRRLSPLALRRKVCSADFYLQNHISARSLLPAFGSGTKTVILHQSSLWHWDARAGFRGRLKQVIAEQYQNLAISRSIAKALPENTPITGNPYDDQMFRIYPDLFREREIIFVGRLVSDKGADLLLAALRLLVARSAHSSVNLRLTIVGTGPEEGALRAGAEGLDVVFAGMLQGENLAQALNRHKVLVIPSIWPEPFGIVALEGAACGCLVIGSDQGGLPEAIGPAGVTFPNGNVEALADCIQNALGGSISIDQNAVREHLAHHTSAAFAERILNFATSSSEV